MLVITVTPVALFQCIEQPTGSVTTAEISSVPLGIEITRVSVSQRGTRLYTKDYTVSGKVWNTGASHLESLEIAVLFYDKEDVLIHADSFIVRDVASGEEKSFEVRVPSVPPHRREVAKVVDHSLRR